MHRFPVVRGHHLYCIPGAAIQKRAILAFADTFLTANAEIRINFNASERRMVLVGNPKHACFDRAILDASRRACAASAAVSRDRKYARLFLASGFAVAFRHGPMFFNDVVHASFEFKVSGFESEKKGHTRACFRFYF